MNEFLTNAKNNELSLLQFYLILGIIGVFIFNFLSYSNLVSSCFNTLIY